MHMLVEYVHNISSLSTRTSGMAVSTGHSPRSHCNCDLHCRALGSDQAVAPGSVHIKKFNVFMDSLKTRIVPWIITSSTISKSKVNLA